MTPTDRAKRKAFASYCGKWMRTHRKSRQHTQESLAVLLNIMPQQVSKYENGRDRLSIFYFLQFCDALGIDPALAMSKLDKVYYEIENGEYRVAAE